MKKINWNYVITTMIIIVAAVFGMILAESSWYEVTASTIIWVAGMILIVEIYGVNEMMKYLKNRDNK